MPALQAKPEESPQFDANIARNAGKLGNLVHLLCDLSGRLVSGFDQRASELGPHAAQSWAGQLEQLETSLAGGRDNEQRQLEWVIGVVVGMSLLVSLAVAVAIMIRTM